MREVERYGAEIELHMPEHWRKQTRWPPHAGAGSLE